MHDIYYFNGQDITMNVCIQIHRVINLIQEQEKIDFEEATGMSTMKVNLLQKRI